VSVLGGKITGYRAIAEEATDAVGRRLNSAARATTAESMLPGSNAQALAAEDPQYAQPLAPDLPDTVAQVIYSVRNEFCRHVSDFLLRRSLAGFSRDQGRAAAPSVARWIGRELGWSEDRRLEEISQYQDSHNEVLL
jgi:glycerol-3-phosphate dehydrogenase